MNRLGLSLAVVVAGLAGPAVAGIINVGPGGSILAAIKSASDGDEIVVAPGTYNEVIDFMGKAITVRSSGGSDVTIIDGTGLAESVVKCINGEGPETVLNGFTITGGDAPSIGDGGGMSIRNADPTVIDCTFVGNSATRGGGIQVSPGNPNIVGCIFRDNTADFGGAIFNAGDPTIANSFFNSNHADFVGGAIYNEVGVNALSLVNCTLVHNGSLIAGGAMFNNDFSLPTVANSIFRSNNPDQIWDELSFTTVSYSNIHGGWPGVGNINVNPMFVEPDGPDEIPGTEDDNYRLLPGSPCIDAGQNWAVPSDSGDLDEDADTTELTPLDLDGNPRFADDAATTDTGCGVTAIVDMGAYEFPGNALDCLRPGDVNGDGSVDVLDLIDLLLAFGSSCEDVCCLADFDVSGSVDVVDLIDLLLAFGTTCP